MTSLEGAVLLAEVQAWFREHSVDHFEICYDGYDCRSNSVHWPSALARALHQWAAQQDDAAVAHFYNTHPALSGTTVTATTWQFCIDEQPRCYHSFEDCGPWVQPKLAYTDS